jgi:hypothetical protein
MSDMNDQYINKALCPSCQKWNNPLDFICNDCREKLCNEVTRLRSELINLKTEVAKLKKEVKYLR